MELTEEDMDTKYESCFFVKPLNKQAIIMGNQ